MARTYEDLLAAQTELMHFNPFHNPKNGQFAKKNGGVSSSKGVVKQRSKDTESIGREEDNASYKYNKPGESGWVGLGRAIKDKTSSLDPKQRKILKTAGIAALSAAGVSILATAGNAVNAQRNLDALGFGDKLIASQVVKAGAKKAGQMALGGALVTIGGHMVKDYFTGNNSKKQKSGE